MAAASCCLLCADLLVVDGSVSSFLFSYKEQVFCNCRCNNGNDRRLVALPAVTMSERKPTLHNVMYTMPIAMRHHNITVSSSTSSSPVVPKQPYTHSAESRAKISSANKGKIPWNAGKTHSEETKAKIAEKTKIAMQLRKEKKAAELGLTLAEYVEKAAKEKTRKRKRSSDKPPRTLTEEGRKRIAEHARERWKDPEYREKYIRKNVTVSNETRQKISDSLKKRAKENKPKKQAQPLSAEARAKISAALKAKWQQEDFRKRMTALINTRKEDWKETLSNSIKLKWSDPQFREKVMTRMREHYSSIPRKESNKPRKRASVSSARTQRNLEKARARALKVERKKALSQVKKSTLLGETGPGHIRQIFGPELWAEEKMLRGVLDDRQLEKLIEEEQHREADRRSFY
eukprot:gene2167-2364_t